MMWCFDSDKLDAALAAFLSTAGAGANPESARLLERSVRVFLEKGPIARIPLTKPAGHYWWSFDEALLKLAFDDFKRATADDLELAREFCVTSTTAFLRSPEARKLRVAELDASQSSGSST